MHEVFPGTPYTLDHYQDLVEQTKRGILDDDWQIVYADLIRGEIFEFFSQHGPALFYLMPDEFNDSLDKQHVNRERPEIVYGMAEELGDLLWFGFSAATKIGEKASDLSIGSLRKATDSDLPNPETFHQLQDLVMFNAKKIKVPTEYALSGHANPEDDEELLYVDLQDDPFYVSQRMFGRLLRSLTGGKHDVSPKTATMLEPITPLPQALGDYLNTIIYIAKARAGVDIGQIAKLNIEKLQRRLAAS